jgi:Domain of unknown function (DUF151)
LGARVARVALVGHAPYTLPYRGVDYLLPLFTARIVLDAGGRAIELNARPSDALVLAVRAGAPLLVREGVLRACGVTEGERAARLAGAQTVMRGGFREPPVPS